MGSIKKHCEKFLTEIAKLADNVFFLVGDTDALPPGAAECLEPENILPHVTHSLLDSRLQHMAQLWINQGLHTGSYRKSQRQRRRSHRLHDVEKCPRRQLRRMRVEGLALHSAPSVV